MLVWWKNWLMLLKSARNGKWQARHLGFLKPLLQRTAANRALVMSPLKPTFFLLLATGENTTGCFDIHTPSKPVGDYFISSNDALQRLVETMTRYHGNCPLCGYSLDVWSFSVLQFGHTARISISCVAGHSLRWYSSSIVAGKFTDNLRSCSLIFL